MLSVTGRYMVEAVGHADLVSNGSLDLAADICFLLLKLAAYTD